MFWIKLNNETDILRGFFFFLFQTSPLRSELVYWNFLLNFVYFMVSFLLLPSVVALFMIPFEVFQHKTSLFVQHAASSSLFLSWIIKIKLRLLTQTLKGISISCTTSFYLEHFFFFFGCRKDAFGVDLRELKLLPWNPDCLVFIVLSLCHVVLCP